MSGERKIQSVIAVDGGTSMLFYLGTLIQRLGYNAVLTRSAEEALRVMEEGVPACVLTEITLPGMSGMNLLKRMKENPRLQNVPVIIQSAQADPAIRDVCLNLGSAAYLAKPVDPKALFHAVEGLSQSPGRRNVRITTSLPVVLGDGPAAAGPERDARVTAISEGGLYVRTLHARPKGAVIPLTIMINRQEITAKAMVLYGHAPGRGPFKEPGMGMKFVEISESDRELIGEYIREQLLTLAEPKKDEGQAGERRP